MSEALSPVEETSPKKKWGFWKKAGVTLLVLVLLLVGLAFWVTRPGPELIISKETTYITEPLKSNGLPDYAAYLNAEFSKGVTPENNALIPLLKAIGTNEYLDGWDVKPYLNHLGVSENEVTAEGIFVDGDDYIASLPADERQAAEENEVVIYYGEPENWTPEKHKHMAAWVKQNARAIDLFIEASKRNRYYFPVVVDENGTLLEALIPSLGDLRSLARAICVRAVLRRQSGDLRGAWSDLMACKRFGRTMRRDECTIIGVLVALTIETLPNREMRQVLADKRLTAEEAKAFLADLKTLPHVPCEAQWLTIERFFMLEAAINLLKNPGLYDQYVTIQCDETERGPEEPNWLQRRIAGAIDPNAMLRRANCWYDRLQDASEVESVGDICQEGDLLEEDIRQLKANTTRPGKVIRVLFKSPEKKGEFAADFLLSILTPSLKYIGILVRRADVDNEFLKIIAAARWCQMETGAYPETLKDLSPKYLSAVPKDPFDPEGGIFKYHKTKEGFILYSVYVNQKDDGGEIEESDDFNGEDYLDWGIAFPPKPKPQEDEELPVPAQPR